MAEAWTAGEAARVAQLEEQTRTLRTGIDDLERRLRTLPPPRTAPPPTIPGAPPPTGIGRVDAIHTLPPVPGRPRPRPRKPSCSG